MRKFKLPRGWYYDTICRLVDEELPPLLGPLTGETAWRYVYSVVLWAEQVDGKAYLHLNDQLTKVAGRELACRGADYLAANLSPAYEGSVLDLVDYIGDEYRRERVLQRTPLPQKVRDPNVTGAAFETVLQVLIERIVGVIPSRTPDLRTLQGFELAPTGYHSRPNLALFSARDFRLLISTKWTLRKERIGTYLHEAYFYKSRRPDLQVAFVVSEYNLNILQWLAQDQLVDRVYHVHLPMLWHSYPLFPDLPGDFVPRSRLTDPGRHRSALYRRLALQERLFDLSQLFVDVSALRASDAPSIPEDEPTDEDEYA